MDISNHGCTKFTSLIVYLVVQGAPLEDQEVDLGVGWVEGREDEWEVVLEVRQLID